MTADPTLSPHRPEPPPAHPPLLSRAVVLLFVATFCAMTGFYLLLSVVPLYAARAGADGVRAGLTTGALMFATVAAELATPLLLARVGYSVVLAAGLVLLGAPALVLAGSAGFATILAVCLVRGVGLAVFVVAGGSMVAWLVPAERRAEGLGWYGVVAGVPAVTALPLGVWLAERWGFPPVFMIAAAVSLAALVTVPGLPARTSPEQEPVGVWAGLGSAGQRRPALLFLVTAMGAGVVVTFLPLVVAGSARLGAMALLTHAAATTTARWWAGRYGGQRDQRSLLVGSVAVAATGMLTLVLASHGVAVLSGALLLGLGFGVAQNASLSLMFTRVSPSGYDMVSAVYNLAYDAGMGVGAFGFGVVAGRSGYVGAFAITAGVMALSLVPTWRDRRWLAGDLGPQRGPSGMT
jgi:predicted MFS family arabinose efflux permease